jgi:hypothetical protein
MMIAVSTKVLETGRARCLAAGRFAHLPHGSIALTRSARSRRRSGGTVCTTPIPATTAASPLVSQFATELFTLSQSAPRSYVGDRQATEPNCQVERMGRAE